MEKTSKRMEALLNARIDYRSYHRISFGTRCRTKTTGYFCLDFDIPDRPFQCLDIKGVNEVKQLPFDGDIGLHGYAGIFCDPLVEVCTRLADGNWNMVTYIGLEETVLLSNIGCALKMSDVYCEIADLNAPTFRLFKEE